ncbi:MAG: nickel-dependent hydrogenase large subunit, partial [Firmicutes bacterium]|nr:nickel-dependent hydrogenase large subunit [Bacillota bacterium]
MSRRRIVIDPVTRIEGHAKISVLLDETGRVAEARFHVTEFRGFEKFCEGRLFWEMPAITARICGICPVSHLIASAKAGDAILAVEIPPAAERLRRLLHLAQLVQSHALSFFHLSSPDLLLGFDAPPAERNLFGVIARYPEVARAGIRLRQYGQTVIELLGGRLRAPARDRSGHHRPSSATTRSSRATRSWRGSHVGESGRSETILQNGCRRGCRSATSSSAADARPAAAARLAEGSAARAPLAACGVPAGSRRAPRRRPFRRAPGLRRQRRWGTST